MLRPDCLRCHAAALTRDQNVLVLVRTGSDTAQAESGIADQARLLRPHNHIIAPLVPNRESMGNKLSRSAPKATGPITSSAARPTAQAQVPRQPASANTTTNPLDGVDPHLKRNLEQLGQVKINKQSTTYRPVCHRAVSEAVLTRR